MNKVQRLIQEICEENNINFSILSKDWVIELEKNGKTRYIIGYKFDLNGNAISNIADDKYALYCILKDKKIPVVKHELFFKTSKNRDKQLLDYFYSHNSDIIIKPNTGTCGINVYHITNCDDLLIKSKSIFKNNNSICLSPFYDIKREYRVIMLDGKCKLVYGKIKPFVIGDGKSTIKDLLYNFNSNYFNNSNAFKNNFNIDFIPSVGEVIPYEWRFNLSKGSIVETNIDECIVKKVVSIATKVIKLTNLNFCSVDIILTLTVLKSKNLPIPYFIRF